MTYKNSLVTGGVQGIGRAIVEEFLNRKDNVFVIDIVDPTHEAVQAFSSSQLSQLCLLHNLLIQDYHTGRQLNLHLQYNRHDA